MTTSNNPPKHHFTHDHSLLKSLILSWLAVLFAGALLHQGIRFFDSHPSLPSFSSLTSLTHSNLPLKTDHTTATTSIDPTTGKTVQWKHYESHGDVELLRRPIELGQAGQYSELFGDSVEGLYAHRAVMTVDLPIEAVLHVFRDTPNNVQWAKDLKEAEEYHKSGAHHKKGGTQTQTTIVRQRYNVPIPGVSDREFLMHKKMTAIENGKGKHSSVTYDFTSIPPSQESKTKDAPPLCTKCVRGINLGSRWTFTNLEAHHDAKPRTRIEVDVSVDPKTPNLSTFFINNFQKNWPHMSVHGLVKVAREHLHREGEVPVTNTFFSLFPLKR